MKLFFSFVLALLLCTAMASETQAQTASDTTIAVKVRGVGCPTDLQLIVANVEKLDGVQKCKIVKQGAITSLKVQYNPEQAGEEAIYTAIEGTACCHDPNLKPHKVKR